MKCSQKLRIQFNHLDYFVVNVSTTIHHQVKNKKETAKYVLNVTNWILLFIAASYFWRFPNECLLK
jgi:hypothetical protein